jgi:hypothetical protein
MEIQVKEGRNIIAYEDENYYVDGVVVVELDHTEIYPATHESPAEYRTEENIIIEELDIITKETDEYAYDVDIKWVVV